MVTFTFISLSDPRLTPDIKARFIRVGQLVNWELTDPSGTYTGLVVVGEKTVPEGFQSMAEFTVDIPPGEGIPIAKVQEISQIVQQEFVQRGIIITQK